MKRKHILAVLFLAGLVLGLVRFYRPRPAHESTPPGLRELMLSSISDGNLDLTRLRLSAPWDRVCLLPSGTSESDAHSKLPFLDPAWSLSAHSDVISSPVTALLLFGSGGEPVGVADLPASRIRFQALGAACIARGSARFPAN